MDNAIPIIQQLHELRSVRPLVHNITNMVVMNNTANALLAIGASPVMAHDKQEIKEVVSLSNALVINIGTISQDVADSMLIAAEHASNIGCPWILDPVGAGISTLRNEVLENLLKLQPTVIRGNASEINALYNFEQVSSKGVDSTTSSLSALARGKALQKKQKAIVCISGEVDYIISETEIIEIHNGNPMMTLVTGLGCTSSALIGAFLGLRQDPFAAATAGVACLSLAGELAYHKAIGPGTLQLHLYDTLYNLSEEDIRNNLKAKHYAYTS